MKPDDVSQEAWDAAAGAIGVPEDDTGWHLTGDLLEPIARAIMAAKAEEREQIAVMIDSGSYDRKIWEETASDAMDNVVSAIRSRT